MVEEELIGVGRVGVTVLSNLKASLATGDFSEAGVRHLQDCIRLSGFRLLGSLPVN